MTQPRNVRIAGWIVLITSGYGLVSLLLAVANNSPHGSLLIGVPTAALGVGLGWALVRGYRWAYVPALLASLASVGWGAWYFFVTLADRYSATVRIPFALAVLALASMPIVLMLTREARTWGTERSP